MRLKPCEVSFTFVFSNGQTKVDYMIGLRSGDIGDYSQPSERLFTQIFNQTGLQTLVYTRYIPTKDNTQLIFTNDESKNVPFYRRTGPFFGVMKKNFFTSNLHILFFSLIGGLS